MGDFRSKGIGRGVIRSLIQETQEEKKRSPIVVEHNLKFASKPPPGTNGVKVALKTNFFKLKFLLSQPLVIHHYDVIIQRVSLSGGGEEMEAAAATVSVGARTRRVRKLEKQLQRVVFDQMVEQRNGFGQLFYNILPVYDGDKNLFISSKLPEEAEEAVRDSNGMVRFTVEALVRESPEGEEKKFTMRLKHVARITIDPEWAFLPQDALQFLDIAFRYAITRNKISIGSTVFSSSPTNRVPLSFNKELAFGFFQSVCNREAGLLLNIDRAACVFHKGGNLVDVFEACIEERHRMVGINTSNIGVMTEELKGMRIKVTHLPFPMKLRIVEFSKKPANQIEFFEQQKDATGKVISETKTTVADYFERNYDRLKHPNWPCVVVGSKDKPRYFPVEVCNLLPNQYVAKKTSLALTAEMTRKSSQQTPQQRFEKISEAINDCVLPEAENFLQEFGIEVNPELMEVTGRILAPPSLKYGNSPTPLRPNKTGDWSMNRPARAFERPIHLKHWVLAELTHSGESVYGDDFLRTFVRSLKLSALQNGMNVEAPNKIRTLKFSPELVESFMKSAKEHVEKLQLIVFMIPKDDKVYATVKRLGDIELGIATQCVSLAHNRNKLINSSYLSNLVLKVNMKLGGVNTCLKVDWSESKKVMFVGIDVTHPSPSDRPPVSIASCVASYDNQFSKYASKLCAQKETSSDIVHLDSQMEFLLETFRNENGGLNPNCVVVYRDGISEGQFSMVSKVEIAKMKQVTAKLDTNPKLTYIVVQKRHNTRFIPVNKKDGNGVGNVLPGTVVDEKIIDPNFFNFFICSHNGQLGTSRPAHYYVLYDENNFRSDVIQRITYNLSFTVGRCNLPISVAAPVYYAHLSAYRSRYYISEALSTSDKSSSESLNSGASGAVKREPNRDFIDSMNKALTVHHTLTNRMYFI